MKIHGKGTRKHFHFWNGQGTSTLKTKRARHFKNVKRENLKHENKLTNFRAFINTVKYFVIKGWVKTHSNNRFLVGGFTNEIFSTNEICRKLWGGLTFGWGVIFLILQYFNTCRLNIFILLSLPIMRTNIYLRNMFKVNYVLYIIKTCKSKCY